MGEANDTGFVAEESPFTFHAPAERLERAGLLPAVESLRNHHVAQSLLEGYPELAVVLNQQRQIVACNQALLDLLGETAPDKVIGRRVGEVLGCIHAAELTGGCGTSEACRTCGAVNDMLGCQNTRQRTVAECRISTGTAEDPRAWELAVVATPLEIDGQELMVFAARDVSAAKRREALERLFFHDILNVAGAIQGLAVLLESGDQSDRGECSDRLDATSRQLIEQIRSQRDLAAAERGELTPTWTRMVVGEFLNDLKATYEAHPVAQDSSIRFAAPGPADLHFESDAVLLHRVLGNLIKNALEASDAGQQVTIGCQLADQDQLIFTVHNATVMPREMQLQVFQRSFSTKGGTGRGLGTFSVKLLTTRYLGGRIEFCSAAGNGTTFTVTLPRWQTDDRTEESVSRRSDSSDGRLDGVKVLLAEDGPDNQRLISHVLKKAGAEVSAVGNGKLALEAVLAAGHQGDPFDCVLMDMQMPVMDGYAATRKLRQDGHTGPIIALTAHAMASDRQKCIDAGCDDYASKPIDRRKLIETVAHYAAGAPAPVGA